MRKYLLTIMTMFFVCCSSDGGMQAETLQTGNDMTMYITIAGQTQSITLANRQHRNSWNGYRTVLSQLRLTPVAASRYGGRLVSRSLRATSR